MDMLVALWARLRGRQARPCARFGVLGEGVAQARSVTPTSCACLRPRSWATLRGGLRTTTVSTREPWPCGCCTSDAGLRTNRSFRKCKTPPTAHPQPSRVLVGSLGYPCILYECIPRSTTHVRASCGLSRVVLLSRQSPNTCSACTYAKLEGVSPPQICFSQLQLQGLTEGAHDRGLPSQRRPALAEAATHTRARRRRAIADTDPRVGAGTLRGRRT